MYFALLNHPERKRFDTSSLPDNATVTSATLREVGLWVDIEATDYTIPGLVDALVKASRNTPAPSA